MMVAVAALAAVCVVVMPGTARASVAGDWNLAFQSRVNGFFASIAAISKNNSWAVGHLFNGSNTVFHPFIRHFDGSGWKVVTIAGARNFTSDWVAASSARNVWILGGSTSDTYPVTVYRYDGSRWHKVPVPALTDLQDPVVLGPANVWAFGSSGTSTADVFHWNGHGWHGYALNLSPEALSASAASNVWVAGQTLSPVQRATAYRWNGARWLSVAMPHPAAADPVGVAASSPSDVWIGRDTATRTSAMHWDGHRWHVITAPDSIPADSYNIVPDGHGGLWFGPSARWTGHAWIGPVQVSPEFFSGFLARPVRIPGTSSFWAAAGVTNFGSSTEEPTIYRYHLT
jgi:hypothetical protein